MKQFRLITFLKVVVLGGFAAIPSKADPLTTPAMTGPIAANASPYDLDFSDLGIADLGTIYVTGVVSGLAFYQSHPARAFAGDNASEFDLANGQVFIQKSDGVVQFFLQAGAYSLPSLGASYIASGPALGDFFGAVPVAYLKIAPTDNFSIQAGKLPTLIGAEYTFTFQNMNIERGLLWNQEPAISRGVQANYSAGAFSVSLSLNDGYYSNTFNWLSGLASWTIDASNTLAIAGGGNLGHTAARTYFATPTLQNNGAMVNLLYTYNASPWLINPYLQYSEVDSGIACFDVASSCKGASTWGVGLLGSYHLAGGWSLAARAEYTAQSGTPCNFTVDDSGGVSGKPSNCFADPGSIDTPSLLYGPGSKAFSLTITPTYQHKVFFARAELSYVHLSGTSSETDICTAGCSPPVVTFRHGTGLGPAGLDDDQVRVLLEAGIAF
ncbi:MAG TPA: outer membrane beta-barrel protein [Rhizomicrobium sp.]|nr:outer membrane beta-barrel protein [Rhizomicrobium sp.]